MISISGTTRIFLCNTPVDLRKGFEGLNFLVENLFCEKITGGAYFVFLNKHKNMMKILYWDGDGCAIWHKRLERGSFRSTSKECCLLTRREFLMLLEGVEPKKLQKRFKI
jgi:transposase